MQNFAAFLVAGVILASAPAVSAEIHAVLVAGSEGIFNYRHQADVAHAFHVLKDHGVNEDNIIVMMYDDIVNDTENPVPGKLFNHPNGSDLYEGLKIDYRREAVNKNNLMAILKGDATGVKGGNGKVLTSTQDDKVFLFFSDHGGSGVLCFPGDDLTVYELNQTLHEMNQKRNYKEFVIYLEACESGSMFDSLPPKLNVLGVTASDATSSSFGAYCGVNVSGTHFAGCLGDEFSVAWMEDSDVEDLNSETMKTQYEIVKKRTKNSEVCKFGDESILAETVAEFQGETKSNSERMEIEDPQDYETWPSRDIPLLFLQSKLENTADFDEQQKVSDDLAQMQAKRAFHDRHTIALIQKILKNRPDIDEKWVLNEKPQRILDFLCHHEVIQAYHTKCFNLGRNSYVSRISAPLTNLCNKKIQSFTIVKAIEEHCSQNDLKMEPIL